MVNTLQRSAGFAAVLAGLGAAAVIAAAPAFATSSVDVTALAQDSVTVDYSCDASAGVSSIQAMVGEASAEGPAATGAQSSVTCDGSQHSASIALSPTAGAAPMPPGAKVQVRAALVDGSENVVTGTARLFEAN
ncbi:hypothetical protein [Nocardia jejuensis]|uniref:hypothetical protein n=1 Tax=Nocardia jejuensis TaxID=328049 RepID=UPI00082A0E23|nr:hypothetical protein [Nocardia jejuensis]